MDNHRASVVVTSLGQLCVAELAVIPPCMLPPGYFEPLPEHLAMQLLEKIIQTWGNLTEHTLAAFCGVQLTELNLPMCGLTDGCLALLADNCAERVNLAHNHRISDAGLFALIACGTESRRSRRQSSGGIDVKVHHQSFASSDGEAPTTPNTPNTPQTPEGGERRRRSGPKACKAKSVPKWARSEKPKMEPGKQAHGRDRRKSDESAMHSSMHCSSRAQARVVRRSSDEMSIGKTWVCDTAWAGWTLQTSTLAQTITSLDLSFCKAITSQGLEIVAALPLLRWLSLAGCTKVTNGCLPHLQHCENLEYLNLNQVEKVSSGLVSITPMLSNLQQLHLNDCAKVTDAVVESIGNLHCLEVLSLRNNHKVSSLGIATLLGCSRLHTVDLYGCYRVDDHCAEYLSQFEALQYLCIADARVTDVGLQRLCTLSSLTTLHLTRVRQLTRCGLLGLKNLTNLRTLRLRSSAADDEVLQALSVLSELEQLNLADTKITDEAMPALAAFKNLRQLQMRGVRASQLDVLAELELLSTLDISGTNIGGSTALQPLRFTTNLQSLMLSSTAITSDSLSAISGLTAMRELDLGSCDSLEDEAMLQLPANLTSLNVGHCHRLTDTALTHVARLHCLESLVLKDLSRVSEAGLLSLRDLQRLVNLDLSGTKSVTNQVLPELCCTLRSLHLVGCDQISANGIRHLVRMSKLSKLSISGCRVSDETIFHLAEVTSLTSLSLDDARVDRALTSRGQQLLQTLQLSELYVRLKL